MRERKSEEVLAGARALFLEHGFGATSVDEIAAAAHVSKATVYSNFPDKAAIFVALLDRVATESALILAGVLARLDGPGPVDVRLQETAVALAEGVLRPEVLALRRLAVAESVRFPGPVAAYYDRGPGSTLRLLERAFGDLVAGGLLVVDDLEEAAGRFAYSVIAPAQDRALLTGTPPDPADLRRTAAAAAAAFYAAHRP